MPQEELILEAKKRKYGRGGNRTGSYPEKEC
jgi:hypothetical protein